MSGDWLMVADGERLTRERLQELSVGRRIIACDGAADYLLSLNMTPDCVIGDLDSISVCAQKILQSKNREIIHVSDQNLCDSEKALRYLRDLKAQSVRMVGVFGSRFDHAWYNLNLLKSYCAHFESLFIARQSENIYLCGDAEVVLTGQSGARVAIMSFYKGSISSSGLQYDVCDWILGVEGRDSTSNSLRLNEATITIEGTVLLSLESTVSIVKHVVHEK